MNIKILARIVSVLLFTLCCLPSNFHSLPLGLDLGGGEYTRNAKNSVFKKQHGIAQLSTGDGSSEKCTFCVDGFMLLQLAVESNFTLEETFPLLNGLCVGALGKGGGDYVCPGFIFSYGPVILYVFTHIALKPRVICEDLHFCSKSFLGAEDSNVHIPSLAHAALVDAETVVARDTTLSLKHQRPLVMLRQLLRDLHRRGDEEVIWKTRVMEMIKSLAPDSKSLNRVTSLDNFPQGTQFGTPTQFEDTRVHRALDKLQKEQTSTKRNNSKIIAPKDGIIRFLQLGDIHLDHDYDEGSPTNCGLYVCCRHWYNGTGKAGHYGAYGCDLPLPTLDLLLDTIQKLEPQPHFIVYTGDNAPHDVWNETWSSQLEATEFIVKYLSSKLPDISIYPTMGNHESWPESEYMGTLLPYKALTHNLAEYWQEWVKLPPQALSSIAEGGYYNIEIMDKLRVVSFNSDYGYAPNFYSYLNSVNEHYKAQLVWMEKQLTEAEQNGDKVLLIAHIPPGDSDNHPEYGQFYLNLTKRFHSNIAGHLFGHTHKDQIQLVQDADGVYGVVLVNPSVTTYGHMNPSFRIFSMDKTSLQLRGYEQYHLNITRANELYSKGSTDKPEFKLSYTTSEEYSLKDLSPTQWAALVERFESYPSLLDKYNYNFHAKSIPTERTCDAACKKRVLCSVTNIISSNYSRCIGE